MFGKILYKMFFRLKRLFVTFEKRQQKSILKSTILYNGVKIGADVKFDHNVKISGY